MMERTAVERKEHPFRGPREFLTVLFKHKTKALAVFSGIFLSVTLVSVLLPSLYVADSTLLVKIGREYLNRPEVGESTPLLSLNQQEVINSEIEILTNRDLIRKVITTLNVENFYPDLFSLGIPVKIPFSDMAPLDHAILGFGKKLNVESVRKSNVIQVSFLHKDPQIAAKAVNLLVELYKEKHLQVFSNPQSSFLEKQLAEYDRLLKDSENRLEQFRQKNQVYSLEEQRTLLLRRRSELDTSLKNAQHQIEEHRKRLATVKNQQKDSSKKPSLYTSSEREKIIVDARSKLLSLQLQEQDFLKLYTEDNRLVQNTRKEILIIQDFLKQQEKEISGKVKTGNVVYQELEKDRNRTEADLNAQAAKAATIQQQIGQLDREIQSLDLLEKESQALMRERAENEKNYKTYQGRVEEARISDDMNLRKMANISIIQEAAVPVKPAKPKRALNIVLGFILAAISGIGVAYFSEFAAQRYSTPESVEQHLGVPVLTTVSDKE